MASIEHDKWTLYHDGEQGNVMINSVRNVAL
jgi:hypothetical protein